MPFEPQLQGLVVPRDPAEEVGLPIFVVSVFQNLTIDMPDAGETKKVFSIPLGVALQLLSHDESAQAGSSSGYCCCPTNRSAHERRPTRLFRSIVVGSTDAGPAMSPLEKSSSGFIYSRDAVLSC